MRALIRLCFRRPVSVTAFYVLVVVLAGAAYVRLPVALLPDLRYPALAVWTAYPDVAPDRVERAVTERVEAAVAGTSGLLGITSRSLVGGSLVELDFAWNTNLDLALLEVREQLDRLGESLPEEAERPLVLRLDPSDRPIMMIALRAPSRSPALPLSRTQAGAPPSSRAAGDHPAGAGDLVALKEIAREVIARRIEQHRYVARVRVTGGYDPRIEIVVDPDRLAVSGVSIEAIGAALREANVALPGGVIRHGPFTYAVEMSGEFEDLEDIEDAIVTWAGRTPVRLRDVAIVRASVEERHGQVELDGGEALLLLVERRPDANTVRAARAVRAVLDELEAELPGIQFDVVIDESHFIEQAIGGVTQAVLGGGLLAVAVLLAFLRRPRVLAAVAVSVPLSLCVTLVLFELLDVSFNLISLGGLALGVGMLVDNAIVVVENIARLEEEGRAPVDAARAGVIEVAGAITASTLTTIVVFVPITFVEGLAGRLFRDQSLAVVCSLLASLLVALTVVPLLAAWRGGNAAGRPAAARGSASPSHPRWVAAYERALAWSLAHRPAVLVVAGLLVAGGGGLVWHLPREVVPEADQGRLEVRMALPPGTSLDVVAARADAMARQVRERGWATSVLADLGERDEARLDLDPRPPYEGDLILLLPEGLTSAAVRANVAALPRPPDVALEVTPVQTQLEALLTSKEADLFIDLVGEDRREAAAAAQAMLAALQRQPALTNVRHAYDNEVPAYLLTFRRDAMARFGVGVSTVSAYLDAAVKGRRVTELRTVNEEIPIVVRAENVRSLEALLGERVPTASGLLPLRTFVDARYAALPAALMRSAQMPIVRLHADVADGADLAAAGRAIEAAFTETLPPRIRGVLRGATDAFRSSLRALLWSLVLSVLLVYLILAAQFESLIQPLIVLSVVPLAVAGVAAALWVTDQTVNLMSLTGCVVLVGIVVNDAIVKLDFINQRRASGATAVEAVMNAGRDRIRPILMTTITTVLGLLPLALSLGEGSELRASLAIAITGGLTASTLLTLFVVPVLYLILDNIRVIKNSNGG